MAAVRVGCPTLWGEDHDLVVLREHVIVPRELENLRSLRWLAEEEHPHLAVTSLSTVERITGAELGLSPYCVPVERWNRAASDDCWLPTVPEAAVSAAACTDRHGCVSLPMPARTHPSIDDAVGSRFYRSVLDRLPSGSAAIGRLFGGTRAVVCASLHGIAAMACVYYLVAAALWLFALRDGMDTIEIQDGGAIVLTGIMFAAATGLLRNRVPTAIDGNAVPRPADGHRHQPLVYTALDAYRRCEPGLASA